MKCQKFQNKNIFLLFFLDSIAAEKNPLNFNFSSSGKINFSLSLQILLKFDQFQYM